MVLVHKRSRFFAWIISERYCINKYGCVSQFLRCLFSFPIYLLVPMLKIISWFYYLKLLLSLYRSIIVTFLIFVWFRSLSSNISHCWITSANDIVSLIVILRSQCVDIIFIITVHGLPFIVVKRNLYNLWLSLHTYVVLEYNWYVGIIVVFPDLFYSRYISIPKSYEVVLLILFYLKVLTSF